LSIGCAARRLKPAPDIEIIRLTRLYRGLL
jgi:hypothetical protein